MNLEIKGKKALVTGGTRGIGQAIAQGLLAEGCFVTITGRTHREGWWSEESNCELKACDFLDKAQTGRFCESVAAEGYDILINNSGAFYAALINEIELHEWESLMEVNLTAPMLLVQATAKHMRSEGWGRIVNVSSIAGRVSRPTLGAYSSSKAALEGFTRAAALDLAESNILINCVCPAYTETDMLAGLEQSARQALLEKVPLKKFATPRDVAAPVLFLTSNQNQFITGQTLVVDGGVIIQ
jgi:3-oxoacyl-[acyl-carrier protein] reductase